MIGSYLPVIRVLSPYLAPSPGIECQDPLIVRKAEELTRGATNSFEKVKKIFEFINSHMHYADKEGDPANLGALSALKTGIGVCEDYSNLMTALLRAAGIPSRTVVGWMGDVDNELTVIDETGVKSPGHIWVEYYLPNYGWIPSDPTYIYLYNGVPQVDYRRLTGLSQLRYAEYSETEEPTAYYSYYGGKVEVQTEIKVFKDMDRPAVDSSADSPALYLESIPLLCDAAPLVEEGRALVPLRGVLSALGAQVDWDEREQKITIQRGGLTIILKIGDETALVDGRAIKLDVPARIVNNRTLVPLRFICETLGLEVNWNSETNVINLKIQ